MMKSTTIEELDFYMLRIWQEAPIPTWRCLLQNLCTEETHAFSCLEDLESFLQAQLQEHTPPTSSHS